MVKKIGSMIKQMRVEAGISQGTLCNGLISVTGLFRIESGEVEQDSFMLSALIQRLGKSMDRFEMAVSKDEYELILLRAFIQENLLYKNYENVEVRLREYEENRESKTEIHQQYLMLIRSTAEYLKEKCAEKYKEKLEEALLLTCPAWEKKNWTELCLCEQEMLIALLYASMQMECGERKQAIELLQELLTYIDVRISSEEAKVRVYPKCSYLLAKVYLSLGEKDKAWEICETCLEILRENGIITFMEDLLEISLVCRADEEKEKVLAALRFAYQHVGYEISDELVLKLMFLAGHQEIILSNELLKGEREARNWSQSKLAEGICARETVSNIERGRKAYPRNLKELLSRMDIDRDIYYASVIADDYETYEKIRDYKRDMFQGNREERLKKLEEIERRIDPELPVNRQFLEANRLIYGNLDKEIGYEKVIERLIECLRYTMPDFDGRIYRIPSIEEMVILNNIALRLKRNGRPMEAMALYRQVIAKYKSSDVSPENHAYSLAMVYLNYAGLLEECNYVKKAERMGKEGMLLMLKIQRGDAVSLFLSNLTCVYDKQKTQVGDKLSEACSRNGYYLLKMFRLNCRIIKQYYEEKYHTIL